MTEAKKTLKKKYVIQRNEFIYGNTTVFTINDLKIFKLIISKVNSQNVLFDDFYEISHDELKALDINQKHLYSHTLTSLKKLANVYITIDSIDKNGKKIIKEVGLIQNSFRFAKYSSKFHISFHPDMKEYLLDIQAKYTKYPLEEISGFKLKHSLKFYEYMKSISFDEVEISLEKLKKRLDLNNAYEKFAMFNKKVLTPALEEINTMTSLHIKWEPIKKGKKVIKIKFIKLKKNALDIVKIINEIHELDRYLKKEFIYNGELFRVISIDKTKHIAKVENINNSDVGNIKALSNDELLEKIEHLVNNGE
jgi:plasmid replication initiation protein